VTGRAEVAVGAVVVLDGHVALVERGRPPGEGLWSIPGGRVEPGETLAEALVREVREEIGLEVRCGDFLGWVERIDPGFHFLIMDFLATPVTTTGGLPNLVAGDDARTALWVPTADTGSLPLVDGLGDFFDRHGLR
jgi:8-oxo-dGTP diphosphatase